MLDFHSHILPNLDDGSKSSEMSMQMLVMSAEQGVDRIVCTPHFYADEDYPDSFLRKRAESVERLKTFAPEFRRRNNFTRPLPKMYLGAEVYYFPSMSYCEDLPKFKITATDYVLVEPPMSAWKDAMLDEIAQAGDNFGFTPVIAHVDRYVSMLGDFSLFERVEERNMKIQVNAEFFLNPVTTKYALRMLNEGRIRFIGSDCHNLTSRPPKMGPVEEMTRNMGLKIPEL